MEIVAILSALIVIGVMILLAVKVARNQRRQVRRLERRLNRLKAGIDRLKRRFDDDP
jgi:uncharacterized membrane-anchored protein YhcB (DUF1043 family)